MEPSPYLPASRRFANPIYLRDRGHRRVRRPRAGGAGSGPGPQPADPRAERGRDRTGPGHRLGRQARGTAVAVRRPAVDRPDRGVRRVLRPGEPGADRLRHLGRDLRRARAGVEQVARGAAGPDRPPPLLPSATRIRTRSSSTAGCSGSSTSSSPAPRPGRRRPACRWASYTTWLSAYTRTVRTRGRCRTCWRRASTSVRRRMRSTSRGRTGRSRHGGRMRWPRPGTPPGGTWSGR